MVGSSTPSSMEPIRLLSRSESPAAIGHPTLSPARRATGAGGASAPHARHQGRFVTRWAHLHVMAHSSIQVAA
jgi:hypothetical protein